jgi:hypothetical protein
MKNIDYISYGYNIFRGDPRSTKVDPGFTGQSIFALKYTG